MLCDCLALLSGPRNELRSGHPAHGPDSELVRGGSRSAPVAPIRDVGEDVHRPGGTHG